MKNILKADVILSKEASRELSWSKRSWDGSGSSGVKISLGISKGASVVVVSSMDVTSAACAEVTRPDTEFELAPLVKLFVNPFVTALVPAFTIPFVIGSGALVIGSGALVIGSGTFVIGSGPFVSISMTVESWQNAT